MVVNYYHLTPPSEYQRRADYNNTYLAIYIIIDFYSITDLDCKVSPLLIFTSVFFFPDFVLFIESFCRPTGACAHVFIHRQQLYTTGLPHRRHMIIVA